MHFVFNINVTSIKIIFDLFVVLDAENHSGHFIFVLYNLFILCFIF